MQKRIFGMENEYGATEIDKHGTCLEQDRLSELCVKILDPIIKNNTNFLENSMKVHIDQGHIECSTPECDSPYNAVVYNKAAERILYNSLKQIDDKEDIHTYIFKHNTDYHGNVFGAHENYLTTRSGFREIFSDPSFMTFIATRQIFSGAGKVMPNGEYRISQRSDSIKTETSPDSTDTKPLLDRRYQTLTPHQDYARFHLTSGDSNMSEHAIYLKLGTTHIVLSMLEDNFLPRDLELSDPIVTVYKTCRDTTLKEEIELKNGKKMTPVSVQEHFLQSAYEYYETHDKEQWVPDILKKWEHVLERLKKKPTDLYKEVDWITKKMILEEYLSRKGQTMKSQKARQFDILYHNIDPHKGIYYKIVRKNKASTLVKEEEIERAIHKPPETTRANVRGKLITYAKRNNIDIIPDWGRVIFYPGDSDNKIDYFLENPFDSKHFYCSGKGDMNIVEKINQEPIHKQKTVN